MPTLTSSRFSSVLRPVLLCLLTAFTLLSPAIGEPLLSPSVSVTSAAPSTTKADTNSKRYWVTTSSGKTHNASCRWYANSNGYYSATGTGNNCMKCGGAGYSDTSTVTSPSISANTPAVAPAKKADTSSTRYWVTSSSGKTHNASCRWYANSNGYYSATGTGNNCKVCGGAH